MPRGVRDSTVNVNVMIATPLEGSLASRIDAVDDRVQVFYEPDLLPPARYPCDHRGIDSYSRSAAQQLRWERLLAASDVLLGIPGDSPEGLATTARRSPRLRWVQATAAGAGEQVRASGLSEADLKRITVTSASGVHMVPLAEFSMLGLLAFAKDLRRMLADQSARTWDRRPMGELRESTLLIVGLGSVGTEVARLGHAFGMRTIALNRTGVSRSPYVADVYPVAQLSAVVDQADNIVVTLPLTTKTRGLIDACTIARMKQGSVLINVGRGGVIDELAMIAALQSGHLGGAVLDVFAAEPVPASSPLWSLNNVMITSHTAALSRRENERIVELFVRNLRRYLRGEALENRIDPRLL